VIDLVISSVFARKQRFKLKNRKTNLYKKCEWYIQQRGANRTHSGSKYTLQRTEREQKSM